MSSRYTQYYQTGGNLRDIGQIYKGPGEQTSSSSSQYYRNQKGEGIGDFFATAYRFLNPLLQSGLSVLGNQAIRSGTNILSDLGKKDLGTIVREQGEQAIKNLSEKAINKIKRGSNNNNSRGGGGGGSATTQVGKGRRKIHHRRSQHRNKIASMIIGSHKKKRGRKPGRKGIKTSSFSGISHSALRRAVGRNIRKAKRIQIGGKRKAKRRTTKRRSAKRQRQLDIFN